MSENFLHGNTFGGKTTESICWKYRIEPAQEDNRPGGPADGWPGKIDKHNVTLNKAFALL